MDALSHLARGAWIEMVPTFTSSLTGACRTSQEVRGLKYVINVKNPFDVRESHLVRGAWIEIALSCPKTQQNPCRTSQEVRGLKYQFQHQLPYTECRTSQEVRGLKLHGVCEEGSGQQSHLARGAWIEIRIDPSEVASGYGRTSQEVRGLKYVSLHPFCRLFIVAPRKRCVD